MKSDINIELTEEDLRKADKSAHRQALIDVGMYSIPTHKVHKNKKKYTRKNKTIDMD